MNRICKEDLYQNKYPRNILKDNIYAVSLLDILKTQKLTIDFCVKYILNEDFQLTKEEEDIKIIDVYHYQPHLSKKQLLNTWFLYQFNKSNLENKENSLSFDEF